MGQRTTDSSVNSTPNPKLRVCLIEINVYNQTTKCETFGSLATHPSQSIRLYLNEEEPPTFALRQREYKYTLWGRLSSPSSLKFEFPGRSECNTILLEVVTCCQEQDVRIPQLPAI